MIKLINHHAARRLVCRRWYSNSPTTPTRHHDTAAGVTALSALLDRHIVGHQDTKECILLGLAACEHVFIQGEPGTAKTFAAELAATAAGLDTYSVQFHRDTRLQDLIGDAIIIRESRNNGGTDHNGGGSEILRQSVDPGGLLTAQVAVLDDLTRAPGEALNVLLRILNERTYQDQPLPLKCAIATANAPRDDMYVEPLDPANLDRFALQAQSDGLIMANDWSSVNQVVDMYHALDKSTNKTASDNVDKELEQAAKALGSMDIHSVHMGQDVKECYVMFLQWLSNHPAVTPRNSLLTDRTFLVKAPRILRAQAALEGRNEVLVKDMVALRHMTTFRVPTAVHQQVCELVKLLAETSPQDGNKDDNNDDSEGFGGTKKDGKKQMTGYFKNFIQQFGDSGSRVPGSRGSNSSDKSKMSMQDNAAEDEEGDEQQQQSTSKAKTKNENAKSESDSLDHDLLADIGGTSILHATVSSFVNSQKDLKERAVRPLRRIWGSFQGPQIKLNLHASAVSGAESVISVVHGRTRRSRSPSSLLQSPGMVGQPRERGRLQSMGDPNLFQDGDTADLSSWLTTPTATLPRGLLRHPKKRGGSIAVARDISDSMWGPRAALASATTQAAINLARQRGMRFGYCEFAGFPKFYNQRSPDQIRDADVNHGDGSFPQAPRFMDAILEWGVGMSNQVGTLLGMQQPQMESSQRSSGHFFGMDYSFCQRRARHLDTDGYTNLQEMLRQMLERFSVSGLPHHERHLLIITDGSPTVGSATCVDEGMLARTLGVAIHPIFVMDAAESSRDVAATKDCYPEVLRFLTEETNGIRFIAKPEVTLDERAEAEDNEYAHLVRVKVELA